MNYKLAFALGLIAPGTVGREPVAWLYNGVRLPKLPELIYPYAVIDIEDKTPYRLRLVSTKPYIQSDTNSVYCDNFSYLYYNYSDGAWVKYTDGNFTGTEGTIIGHYNEVIWANTDILCGDTVFVQASEPIPVYE